MEETEQLEQAIRALETQRAVLGDAVVDAALAPMRAKLDLLRRVAASSEPFAEQRKHVTVLFADLVGFTAMSEQMDPEDVREVINAYFARWATCIEQNGGVVEKFIGDAVMAVFGLVTAQENDPERAIRAGLAMREALVTLNTELASTRSMPLSMRVGIHTGPVVVSLLGERKGQEFVVVGDTVNLASRLQTVAPEGGVLISHDTYRHVRGLCVVQELPPVRVKGKADLVQTYLVTGLKSSAFRILTRGVEGVETRTIGRQADLERLQEAFTQVLDDGSLRMVSLVGEAGIGKSRLLYDLDNWLELIPEVTMYFKGRAVPSMQTMAYSLWRDVLAFRFGIQDTDPPPTVREKLESGLVRAYGTPASDGSPAGAPLEVDIARHARDIAALLGFQVEQVEEAAFRFGENARQVRDRGQAYLSEYFRTLASRPTLRGSRRTVVILLEDLHWADDSSLDMIEGLAQSLAHERVFIVGATRPSLFERCPQWAAGLGATHLRLDLGPLSPENSLALVDEILQKAGQVPAALRELVANHAEGNPFYMEELVKMLIEDGVILKEQDEEGNETWRVEASRMGDLRVPPTLMGVLQARFDSLHPHYRVVLQRASIIGRIFWDQAVASLRDEAPVPADSSRQNLPPDPELPLALQVLREREMIVQRDESAFRGAREYLFKHALLRDVTYESVLKRRRRLYHAYAGHWLVDATQGSGRAEEYAALIAGHFDRAGETALAVGWYARAGRRAATQYANVEAIHLLSRGLDLAPKEDIFHRFQLLLEREKIFHLLGQRARQFQDLEEMEILAEKLDRPVEGSRQSPLSNRIEVLLRRSGYHEATGDYPAAIRFARQAAELAHTAGDQDREARGYHRLGQSFWRQADYAAARTALENSLSLAQGAGLVEIEADNQRVLGFLFEATGDYQETRVRYQMALDLYRRLGNRYGEGRALNDLGIISFNQGDYAGARQYYENSLAIKRELGDRHGEGSTLNNLGLVAHYQGDPLSARIFFEESLALCREIGDQEGESAAASGLGAVAYSLGDLAQARAYHQSALSLCIKIGDQQGEAASRAYLSLLDYQAGDYSMALAWARQTLDLATSLGLQRELGYALTYLGYAHLGNHEILPALDAFRRSVELRQELGGGSVVVEAQAGMAGALLAQSQALPVDHEAAASLLAQALAIAREIAAYLLADHSLSNQPRSGAHPSDGMDDPYRVYLTCYQVMAAAGDPLARDVLEAGLHLLYERAARLGDETLRRAFLQNIPSRRALSALRENSVA